MKFYDREKEIETLKNLPQGTNLVVIYGRRRIGKTRLVMEFLKGRKHRYVFVPSDVGKARFLRELSETHGIPEFVYLKDAIRHLLESSDNIFFDEFQNFRYMDPSIFSGFQELIDSLDFEGKNINIFVAGSSNSIMRDIFMTYSKPLYGRAKGVMRLGPLPFAAVSKILDDAGINDFKEKIEYYSVFGGVPKYYEYLGRKQSFENQMRDMFFTGASPLREEGKMVLLSEFGGEFSGYLSVLDAIANGNRTVGDIASALSVKSTAVSKYLDILRKEYGIVKRMVPATEDPRKSKRGVYVIDDNFLSFWFRFVKRYESYYEQGLEEEVFEFFVRDFPSHASFFFEELSRDAVKKTESFERVGSWWNRKGDEIDIVALNEKKKEILFGEVKWRNRPVGCDIIDELMEKKELVKWNNEGRKEKFLIVSKSGFTKKCIERMDDEGIMHWDLGDVEKMIHDMQNPKNGL